MRSAAARCALDVVTHADAVPPFSAAASLPPPSHLLPPCLFTCPAAPPSRLAAQPSALRAVSLPRWRIHGKRTSCRSSKMSLVRRRSKSVRSAKALRAVPVEMQPAHRLFSLFAIFGEDAIVPAAAIDVVAR